MASSSADPERAATLERLLKEHHAESYRLPNLGEANWIKYLRSLRDWILDHLFPEVSQGTGELIAEILKYLAISVIVVLVGLALFAIVRLIVRKLAPGDLEAIDISQIRAARTFDWDADAQAAIVLARSAGDWPKALRLRWILFLRRLDVSRASTPFELLNLRSHLVAELGVRTGKLYEHMFLTSSARDFEEHDRFLGDLEGSSQQDRERRHA